MTKLLVVDDEVDLQDLFRQRFRKQIKQGIYQFVFALNGQEALSKIQEDPSIDIVLSDINMPVMDGLTFLGLLKDSAPLIKTIVVSAYGDMDNLRVAMNNGAFDFITKPIDFKDLIITIEKTVGHTRQLKNTIRAIKENNLLKMYVDESVINFMGSRDYDATIMSNEAIIGTVMFIDICSFTTISEQADPDTVVRLLNSYFDIMAKSIVSHEGQIDKFMGDAVMALFRGDNQLPNAIKAAIAIRKNIEQIPTTLNDISFRPKVSIGINNGEMISGNIGSESLKRLDYTVIGDTVNIAQRLESIAKENEILITEKSLASIGAQFQTEELGPVKLKNKSDDIKVYNIMG